eukprot:Gb_36341 [translate_table: standard]
MERGFARVLGVGLHSGDAPRLPLTLVSGFGLTVEDHRLTPSRGEEGSLHIEDDYGTFYGLNGNVGCLCLVFLRQCMVDSLFPPFWRWSNGVEDLKPTRVSQRFLGGSVVRLVFAAREEDGVLVTLVAACFRLLVWVCLVLVSASFLRWFCLNSWCPMWLSVEVVRGVYGSFLSYAPCLLAPYVVSDLC